MKRIGRVLVVGLMVLVCGNVLAAMQAPAARGKTAAKPEEIKKAVDRLIREGEGALAAGDFKAARDSFMDALQLDKKNMLAGHGLGLAISRELVTGMGGTLTLENAGPSGCMARLTLPSAAAAR